MKVEIKNDNKTIYIIVSIKVIPEEFLILFK